MNSLPILGLLLLLISHPIQAQESQYGLSLESIHVGRTRTGNHFFGLIHGHDTLWASLAWMDAGGSYSWSNKYGKVSSGDDVDGGGFGAQGYERVGNGLAVGIALMNHGGGGDAFGTTLETGLLRALTTVIGVTSPIGFLSNLFRGGIIGLIASLLESLIDFSFPNCDGPLGIDVYGFSPEMLDAMEIGDKVTQEFRFATTDGCQGSNYVAVIGVSRLAGETEAFVWEGVATPIRVVNLVDPTYTFNMPLIEKYDGGRLRLSNSTTGIL